MQFSDWQQVKRLLVVYVGDTEAVVQINPALRMLRTALPDVAIAFLTSLSESEVTSLLPWVNYVLHYATLWHPATIEKKLIERLCEHQFDATIIFTNEAHSPLALAYLCYLAGIPIRIGQSKEFGGSVLSHWIKSPADDIQVDRHLHLLESVGFPVSQLSGVMCEF